LFFFIQLEKLNPQTSGQYVHLCLVLAFTLEEEYEVASEQKEAKDGQEDPERWKSDNVDECYDQPEEDRQYLTEPKHQHIHHRRLSALRRFETPFFLVIFTEFSVPTQSSQLPTVDILRDPEISRSKGRHQHESQKILVSHHLQDDIPWLAKKYLSG
jgi:hypothetical protein